PSDSRRAACPEPIPGPASARRRRSGASAGMGRGVLERQARDHGPQLFDCKPALVAVAAVAEPVRTALDALGFLAEVLVPLVRGGQDHVTVRILEGVAGVVLG